jgi:hypothetical protein
MRIAREAAVRARQPVNLVDDESTISVPRWDHMGREVVIRALDEPSIYVSDSSAYNYTVSLDLEEAVQILSLLAHPSPAIVEEVKGRLASSRDDLARLLAYAVGFEPTQ